MNIYFFAYAPLLNSGSSYLRSQELCAIARADDRFEQLQLAVTTSMDLDDSVVILNKSALEVLRYEDFDHLKDRGNILIADPLDAALPDRFLARFDCLVAASLEQLAYYQGHISIRSAYIAHHVDTRISSIPVKADRFSLGYFGEITHARYPRELGDCVSFVSVDTRSAADTGWMNELKFHNAHYLIRSSDESGGFKPFTKGFIAAHCAAPVIVARSDREARHFLPACYPYTADADRIEDVRRVISHLRDDFLSTDWRLAQDAMRSMLGACSTTTISAQLYETVAAYL